jgi:hypothetical protein
MGGLDKEHSDQYRRSRLIHSPIRLLPFAMGFSYSDGILNCNKHRPLFAGKFQDSWPYDFLIEGIEYWYELIKLKPLLSSLLSF